MGTNTSTFVGTFRASQSRERLLRRNSYSQMIVVFNDGLVLVEASPLRDAAAALRFVPVPFPDHTLARQLVRQGPKYGGHRPAAFRLRFDHARIGQRSLPELRTGLDEHQITSAVLRRIARQLWIKYQGKDGRATSSGSACRCRRTSTMFRT